MKLYGLILATVTSLAAIAVAEQPVSAKIDFNRGWSFMKSPAEWPVEFNEENKTMEPVILPHTRNAEDMGPGLTTLPLRLEPSGSVFVVFRKPMSKSVPVVSVSKNGANIVPDPAVPASGWASMELQAGAGKNVDFLGWEPGRYEMKAANGKSGVVEVKGIPGDANFRSLGIIFPDQLGCA